MDNSNNSSVSVILPAYNEEDSVGVQIQTIRHVMNNEGITHEIILVDDGSKDKTAMKAKAAGARVIQHPDNRGYGASLKTGIREAEHDVIVIIDADGTYPPEAIPRMLTSLKKADMVVGARIGEKVSSPRVRKPAKWFLRKFAERIAEQPIPDLNSGLRAFRKACANQYMSILPNRFSFTTTITLALMADDYFVDYQTIDYKPRIGKSKIAAWHFMDFIVLILRISMMFNPLKIFVPLALISGGLGILKTFYDIAALFLRSPTKGWELLLEPVFSTSALLLLFVGLQFLMIGMVADGVIRRIGQQSKPLVPTQHEWSEYK